MAADSGPTAIDHVGLAVADLDAAVAFYERRFGASPSHREAVPRDGVVAVFFDFGPSSLELLGSTRADSSVGRFLERRGEGLHHLAYLVSDIEAELSRWRAQGADLIDEHGRPGARGRLVAFIHPKSAGGVLTELCQLRGLPG
ncbi:MAG TPA: methylmalonyl-CoA epimerase [Candidatus Dormibacteraeota bacterium]|nr:methylmalonyl-CoA epimerase [Candidatus Dormibacteraeota bacterium]